MNRVIVIIAPDNDTHALVVKRALETRFATDAMIWDTSHLVVSDLLTFRSAPSDDLLSLNLSGHALASSEIRSIWWRRPNGFAASGVTATDPVSRFCANEYAALLYGALASLDTPIVNTPQAEQLANRKPFQLTVARRVGLETPRTLISNDAADVRAFWEDMGRDCIYKTLTPSADRFLETRRLTEDDLSHLDSLRYAPIIVQERVPGRDVRVTVLGSQLFAAMVKTHVPEAETDWRLDLTCQWDEYRVDSTVERGLRSLVKALGLHYGCIDLRVRPDGTSVFLEINPSGQFLFIEVDTGRPLVDAMALLLLDPASGIAAV